MRFTRSTRANRLARNTDEREGNAYALEITDAGREFLTGAVA